MKGHTFQLFVLGDAASFVISEFNLFLPLEWKLHKLRGFGSVTSLSLVLLQGGAHSRCSKDICMMVLFLCLKLFLEVNDYFRMFKAASLQETSSTQFQ